MSLADTIVVMNKGEILQADDTDGIYNFPSCLFVAGFIGRPAMNLLPLALGVTEGDSTARFHDVEVAIPTMRASASHAVLGVRPEHIDLLPAGQGVPARINYCEYFGSHWVADLESPLGTLKAVASKDQRPVEGEAVGLRLHTERLVLFDRKTELLMASDSTLQHQPGMRHG
jgi:multiple sugar transport system ATP-binding protein